MALLSLRGAMRFPNLCWALSEKSLAHWKIALKIPMEPSTFSRRLNGRGDFTTTERERIAQILGYPAEWLFQILVPPTVEPERSRREGT
jgi:hypothetical protein